MILNQTFLKLVLFHFSAFGLGGNITNHVLGHSIIASIMIILSLIMYLFLLLYLMITLRKQLLLLVNNHNNHGRGSSKSTSSIWNLMKRLTILAIASCSVSLPIPIMFSISDILIQIIHQDYQESNNIITSIGWMIMYNLDILCIILQFSCYDKIYNCLCSKCQQLNICKQKTISSNMQSSVAIDAKQ